MNHLAAKVGLFLLTTGVFAFGLVAVAVAGA
jgi:hypothetical protein